MNCRLSTDSVDEKARFDYWQHICGKLIGTFEINDCVADGFDSHIDLSTVADLKIGHFIGASQTMHRKKSLIKSYDNDDYVVLLESNKTFMIDHCGRHRSGSGGIMLADIAKPYYCTHPEGMDVIDFFVPRSRLEHAFTPIRHAAGLTIEPQQTMHPIILNFLTSLQRHGSSLSSREAERLSSIAIDLIVAGFSERMGLESSQLMGRAALLWRAQAYIAEKVDRVGLNITEVAAALKISVRRLHQIASEENVSLTDWMWERRLLRAKTLLRDPSRQSVHIGLIANQAGFVDQAHFSRRFKKRFGKSPKEFRQSAVADINKDSTT